MHTCNSVFLNWHQRYGMKAKNVPVHFKVPFLYQKHFTVYPHSFSTNAHMRFFAAAVKQPGCATDGEGNAKFSHFPHDLVQSVCALHKHEAFALSQHVLRPYPSRNLDVARRIYNYTLTRARIMVECAFGIVCNKWRIFHCATDVCPDFCDVTVKTCCILHYFRQRDGLQFQDTL